MGKVLILTVFLIEVNCRNVNRYHKDTTYYVDKANILEYDIEDALAEKPFESIQPTYLRKTRQVHGDVAANQDDTYNLNTKDSLVDNDETAIWIATGSINVFDDDMRKNDAADLALDKVKGQSLLVTKIHIPSFRDQLIAEGKVNLTSKPDYNMNHNAFVTRNIPQYPGTSKP